MENAHTNPFFVALFFIIRCLLPLFIMLGISYLLKRLGLIAPPPKPPPDKDDGHNDQGGFAHV